MSKIWIKDIQHYIPEQCLTNEDVIKKYNIRMKPGWVKKIVGIEKRHWAPKEMAASDLAFEAVSKMDLKDFDGAIFVSTISGDYPTPSTSSIVKRKLGLSNLKPAIDLNAACAGQIFALEMAFHRLKATDETQALVIASEIRSRFLNMQDRRTAFIFADGACSILLEKSDNAPGEIEWILSRTYPSDKYEIYIPAGGSAKPITSEVIEKNEHCITMTDGAKIVDVTTDKMVSSIKEYLNEKRMSLSDFDYFVSHQGNGNLIRKICSNMEIPEEKTWINFETVGNTASASMGISLSQAYAAKKFKKGERVLVLAMGAGYHLAFASIIWGLD